MSDPFTIRPLATHEELLACVELQKLTWGEDFTELVPTAILWATQQVGGICAGAFDAAGQLAGFVFGLSGVRDGRLAHWSDMLAVRPDLRGRGLGERLKRYQREQLLERGVEVVYWTFDPLVARNAYLNFARLGVLAREYRRDLYGAAFSPLFRGIGTDRLIAEWWLPSERVRGRLGGENPAPAATDVADVPLVNPPRAGTAGPECAEPELGMAAERVRVAIPADIHALQERAPELALDWRTKTRAALESYLGRGYVAVELIREREGEGAGSSYLLERRR